MTHPKTKRLIVIAVVLSLGLAFGLGVYVGFARPETIGLKNWNLEFQSLGRGSSDNLIYLAKNRQPTQTFDLFWKVWELAQSKHFDAPANTTEMIYGAINGMLRFGLKDKYSYFLPPEKDFYQLDQLATTVGDIGIEMDLSSSDLVIVNVVPDGPAGNAGIQDGDLIVSLSGKSVQGMSLMDAQLELLGKVSSKVHIVTLRMQNNQWVEKDYDLVRAPVKTETLNWTELEKGVYDINVDRFSDQTLKQWGNTVNVIANKDLKGIILDLRGNGGGLTQAVVPMVSDFVPAGVVFTQADRNGDRKNWSVTRHGKLTDVPVVVLVNRGTASAAEMVAAALQDHARATLVGTNTFGKGVIQQLYTFAIPGEIAPAVLSLEHLKWYTPNGKSVEGVGLTPDSVVTPTAADWAANKDTVMFKAKELLRAKIDQASGGTP